MPEFVSVSTNWIMPVVFYILCSYFNVHYYVNNVLITGSWRILFVTEMRSVKRLQGMRTNVSAIRLSITLFFLSSGLLNATSVTYFYVCIVLDICRGIIFAIAASESGNNY